MSKTASRWHAFLHKPLWGTRPSMRGGRVDAARFSEEGYPVHCPRCRYLLRGLPDGRCPECGEPFDRGHLLVQEYVHDPDGHPVTHARWRLIERAGLTCVGIFLTSAVAVLVFVLIDRLFHLPDWTHVIPEILILSAVALLGVASMIYIAFNLLAMCVWLFTKPSDYDRKRDHIRNAVLWRNWRGDDST